MIKLKTLDWKVYNYLKAEFKKDNTLWISKKQLLESIPELRANSKATTHDVCSSLNTIRLRLNKACSDGQLSHLVLLKDSCFKIAKDREEAKENFERDRKIGIQRLVRYYENIGVLNRDGQGKLIDCKGNVITDESLAKRFNDVFNVK